MKKNILILIIIVIASGLSQAQGDTWPQILARLADYNLTAQSVQKPLPYSFDALAPSIDAKTMEIHYSRHHAAYTRNMNDAVKDKAYASEPLFSLFNRMGSLPAGLKNNAGGFYNHEIFWAMMKPGGNAKPGPELLAAIDRDFGSFENFAGQFEKAAGARFGSGWAWLSVGLDGKLFISSTPNQDNPLMDVADQRGIPVLGLDVWEHAYYLEYQNRRADYIKNFWNIVNWEEVHRRYKEAHGAIR